MDARFADFRYQFTPPFAPPLSFDTPCLDHLAHAHDTICGLALNQTELTVSLIRSAGIFARPRLAVGDLLILN